MSIEVMRYLYVTIGMSKLDIPITGMPFGTKNIHKFDVLQFISWKLIVYHKDLGREPLVVSCERTVRSGGGLVICAKMIAPRGRVVALYCSCANRPP